MNLSFLFGPFSTYPRPLEFSNMLDSPRGLTGTDNSFVGYARAMRQRGHDVTIYAEGVEAQWWEGVEVRPYATRERCNGTADAVLCWNDIAGFDVISPKIPRILDMQVNDLGYAPQSAQRNVDLFLAPSQALVNHLRALHDPPGAKWDVLPNGCDPTAYTLENKIPGRCIHASSTDRGLHILLQQWPRIRAAIPHATLRIFYHTLHAFLNCLNERNDEPQHRERRRRARIIRDALPRLEKLGVTYEGGVSRTRMAAEYSAAQVLAYPCDTLRVYKDGWGSEGFGVAVLEGCASGAVPVITDADAFGEIYGDSCPMVRGRSDGWTDRWGDMVIATLRDGEMREHWQAKGCALAEKHAWPVLAERLEKLVLGAIGEKRNGY